MNAKLPAVGDLVELRPGELVAGGDSLSRIAGFPIFVPALYPGDVARVEITEMKKGFGRGAVVAILEESGARRSLPCPIAGECGGCDWTALRLDHQLRAKRKILLDSLRRIGKLDPESLPPLRVHPSPLNYRLRSRLHADENGEVGFFALRSNRIVPLSMECEVVGPGVLENWAQVERIGRSARGGSIETFETGSFITAAPVTGSRQHQPPLSIRAGDFRYQVSISAFFQVNRHLLPRLIRLVEASGRSAASHQRAFDLYAGVGFFTLPLAAIFGNVVAVESSPLTHAHAVANLSGHPNAATRNMPVERFLASDRDADFIMADPPRAGLSPEVIEAIDAGRARRICYLSCDPVTFSRDASRLVRRGWTLASLDLLDLFPNTHHIETLSSFERAS